MSDMITQLSSLLGIDTLLPASFRGVNFECLYTRDTLARDTIMYAPPYQDGATTEDQGLKAVNFRLTALLFGSDWKQQLKALLTTFKTAGVGELVHPVYGPIPNAQFLEAGVEKHVEPLDAVTVELVFIESGTEQALFAAASADEAAQSISLTGNDLLDEAASDFASALQAMKDLKNGLEQINNVVAEAEYLLQTVEGEVQGTVSAFSNLLDTPAAFVSDLKSVLDTFSDSLTLTGASISASWLSLTRLTTQVLETPEDYASTQDVTVVSHPFSLPLSQTIGVIDDDTALVTRTAQLVTVTELAEVASTILQNESDSPSQTRTQTERVVNDTRQAIEDAIVTQRAVMQDNIRAASEQNVTADTRTTAAIIRNLQALAYTLQMQGAALIQRQPLLVTREVVRHCTLSILAFEWYGDAGRAAELLRLNPGIRNPNNLLPGDTLYACAR
ncbi:DNA circularization protein [Trabulsiella odontotermitis]|uniref:LysM domain-containing protein n=1 Tax=Trabulsiella odontotermitis TaxID=379893 RepID=A0A0L0GPZ6_9ENTR|nr:DNA circularization N-terminal domain-containing protein [Trabulsiella odontotermitis]KNC91100.1 hypothetical protein GM31_02710 [Trabulsiella odontotermitis]